jgi:hypothetical protein
MNVQAIPVALDKYPLTMVSFDFGVHGRLAANFGPSGALAC